MEIAEQRRLKRVRTWGTRLGLCVEILRTRERVRLGFYLRDASGRVVATTEQGLTLDEIESELLKREKKLTRKSRE
jgi:Tfp pilus assembly protein PilP